jgi:hypothetical protein
MHKHIKRGKVDKNVVDEVNITIKICAKLYAALMDYGEEHPDLLSMDALSGSLFYSALMGDAAGLTEEGYISWPATMSRVRTGTRK